jgi:defect in organelle trafficking protein DotA
MKFFVALLLLCFFPSLVLADNTGVPWFTPVPGDISVGYLADIFGVVDGVLHGAGSQIMGAMFGVFNSAMLCLGGIIIMYTLFVGTLRTAHEGEVLGREWSSIWIPIRSVAGFALLMPKVSGYSLIQIFVMWVVVQGIGAADTVWQAAVGYLVRGGTLVQPTQSNAQNSYMVVVAGNVLKMETCMYALQNALNNLNYPPPPAVPPSPFIVVPDLFTTLTVVGNNSGLNPPCYPGDTSMRCQLPSKPDTNGVIYFPGTTNIGGITKPNYAGACGQLSWLFPTDSNGNVYYNGGVGGNASAPNNPAQLGASDARSLAVWQLVSDMRPFAQDLANILIPPQSPYATPSACAQDPTCATTISNWTSTNQNNIVFAATDYMGLMSPYLTQKSQQDVQDAENTLQASTSQGWILAGSYYLTLSAFAKAQNPSETAKSAQFTYGTNPTILVYNDFSSGFPDVTAQMPYLSSTTYPELGLSPNTNPGLLPNNLLDKYLASEQTNAATQAATGQTGINSTQVMSPTAAQDITITGAVLTGVGVGAIGIPMALVGGMMWDVIDHLNQLTQPDVDPIGAISSLGIHIVNWVQVIWTMGTVAVFITALLMSAVSCMNPAPYAIGAAMMWFVPMLTAILLAMLTAGAVMAYYVPIIPFLLFLFTAIGWFISVIEAMIAAPLVALGIAHPEGQHQILGRAEPAIMLLAGVFMRPALIVMGFVAASILVRVSLWLFNMGFFQAIGGTNLSSGGGFSGGLVGMAALMVIYVWIVMEIIERCFALIHEIPARTLRWIGGQLESFGEEQAMRGVKSGFEGGMAAIKGGMEAGGPKAAGEIGTAAGKEAKAQGWGKSSSVSSTIKPGGANPAAGDAKPNMQ